jgi:hypothetical protein
MRIADVIQSQAEEVQKARQGRREILSLYGDLYSEYSEAHKAAANRFLMQYKKIVTEIRPAPEASVSPRPFSPVDEHEETTEFRMLPMSRAPREVLSGLYVRDAALFTQLMRYSKLGTSWLWTPCCYCGDPYEHDEHVFPLAALAKLLAVGDVQIDRDLLRIVPACAECNLLAQDKVFWAFRAKRAYIKEQLARKHAATLKCPVWTDQELATLIGFLRDYVMAGQDMRDDMLNRLRY